MTLTTHNNRRVSMATFHKLDLADLTDGGFQQIAVLGKGPARPAVATGLPPEAIDFPRKPRH